MRKGQSISEQPLGPLEFHKITKNLYKINTNIGVYLCPWLLWFLLARSAFPDEKLQENCTNVLLEFSAPCVFSLLCSPPCNLPWRELISCTRRCFSLFLLCSRMVVSFQSRAKTFLQLCFLLWHRRERTFLIREFYLISATKD